MSDVEVGEAMSELSRIMAETEPQPLRLAVCIGRLNAAIQDDSTAIAAEAFAELSDAGRKLALSGLLFLVATTFAVSLPE